MNLTENQFNFNLWPFLWAFVFGLAIYLIFLTIKRIAIPLLAAPHIKEKLLNEYPKLMRLFWVLFVMSCAFALIRPNPILGAFAVAVLVLATWFFLKNYLMGLVVLLEGNYKVGQKIRFLEYRGTIKALNSMSCEIELDNKELLNIAYSKLLAEPIIKTSPSEKLASAQFSISVKKTNNIDNTRKQLESELMKMPWILPGIEPIIELERESADALHFKIVVLGLQLEQLSKVERLLKEQYNT